MWQRNIIVLWDFSTSRVHDASRYCEGLGCDYTGARKVGLGVCVEVLDDLGGIAVGEEEADIAGEVFG
jgi:hypothetical protein